MAAKRAPCAGRALSGFTLVELLVALVLVGMISAALFTAMRYSARSWRAGEARIVDATDGDAVRHFLRARLTESMPVTMPSTDRTREPVFRGDGTHLRFAAPMPHGLGLGGVYMFTLGPGEGAPLMLDWQLLRPDRLLDVSDGRQRPRPLAIAGVRAVHFRYFGQRERAVEPAWTEVWDG
ncbi:MAG: prepilin-type N-terminal cleavage/methylation domain-containing protein, partial [Rhodothalassiaceae bacterium]